MKKILTVEVKNYDIVISDEEITKLRDDLDIETYGQKRLFVVSKKVYGLYQKYLNLPEEETLILNDGEREKNPKNYLKIIEAASRAELTRSDVIVAIGGGVIGDLAGFAASTYMRGIDYIQVPTTLLSMVDSSVGGKTAIDVAGVKNIAGTFYQPKKVFVNIKFLDTLDNRQYYSGLGEVMKYAFIEDSCQYSTPIYLFEYLTLCAEKLQEKDPITVSRVIEYCLNLKIAVVNQDEKESGLRKILNFGHTFAHAIESLSGFKKFTHGEAVVQGIYFALKWAHNDGLISYSYYRLSLDLLDKYHFESKELIKNKCYSPLEIIDAMKNDKKVQKDKITFIIPYDKKHVKEVKIKPIDLLEKLQK